MDHGLDLRIVQQFATALLIGALIGIEREKRKSSEGELSSGGLRTFILISQLGAMSGWLSRIYDMPWLMPGTLLAVTALVVTSYVVSVRAQPNSIGITTEVAAIVVFLLGAITMLGYQELAIGLGVVTAAILAYKQPLHGIVQKIGWDDVFAGLRLLIATFIVLPLLPVEAVDPWGALKPYSIWLLVLLISSLSLIGYVATRALGADKGVFLTALSGGLISSTAVTLSFARRSGDKQAPAMASLLASGILLAWGIMFGRVIIEVLVVNTELVAAVLTPFAAMGVAGGACAFFLFRRGVATRRPAEHTEELHLKNPFSLTEAAKFGAFFAAVLLIVKLVQLHFPGEGIYVVAALAGMTDVDAITLSMAEYAKTGDREIAVTAIVIAALSNTLVKCGLVLALGSSSLRTPILIGTVAILIAGLAAVLLA